MKKSYDEIFALHTIRKVKLLKKTKPSKFRNDMVTFHTLYRHIFAQYIKEIIVCFILIDARCLCFFLKNIRTVYHVLELSFCAAIISRKSCMCYLNTMYYLVYM